MNKIKPYLLWALKIVISLLFILASTGKLTANEAVIEMFRNWGFFDGFYLIIGIIEFALAILLLIPRTSLYAALSLFVLMIGALITHLINDPISEIIRPLIFMILLATIIFFQWNKREHD